MCPLLGVSAQGGSTVIHYFLAMKIAMCKLMNTASDQQNYESKYMYRIEGPGNKANCKPQYDSVLVAWTGCLNDANDVAWLGIFSTGCYSGTKT